MLLFPALTRFLKSSDFFLVLNSSVEREVLSAFLANPRWKSIVLSDYLGLSKMLGPAKALRAVNFENVFVQADVCWWKVVPFLLLSGVSLQKIWSMIARTYLNKPDSLRHKARINIHNFDVKREFAPTEPSVPDYPLITFSDDSKLIVNRFIDQLGLVRQLVGCGVGSFYKESHKRLPSQVWVEFFSQQKKLWPESSFVLIGKEQEEQQIDEILELCRAKSLQNIVRLPPTFGIKETVYLISRAEMVVSNCNSVSHMAALARRPIVGLFGPTDYCRTGPFTDRLSIVSAHLSCSPCYSKTPSGYERSVCMSSIEASDITDAVLELGKLS